MDIAGNPGGGDIAILRRVGSVEPCVLTAEEAADLYPEPRSRVLREVDDEPIDTTPDLFRPLSNSPADASPQRQDVSVGQTPVANTTRVSRAPCGSANHRWRRAHNAAWLISPTSI